MSRRAGAGREHSQAASPRWPMEIFYTTAIRLSLLMGVGWGAGICSALCHKFESSLVQEFKLLWELLNLRNPRVPGSTVAAWGLAVNWSLGGEKSVF